MDISERSFQRTDDSSLSGDERARALLRHSKEFEEAGDYEAAREALGELWRRVGERPRLEGLGRGAQAELLLRAGVLTSFIGSDKQIGRAQETAKDLISESLSTFEELGDGERVAEAQIELAFCYWRQGAFDEARVLLRQALDRLSGSGSELEAFALFRSAIVERSSNRLHESLRIYAESGAILERLGSHSLKGRFHVGYANLLLFLSEAERREEYVDRALVEFTAAVYHFEQAGHTRYHACVENNLANLFLGIGKYEEAHAHLDRARALFTRLSDGVHLAQVEETRARVLLAEGRCVEAEAAALSAVRTLEKGDERSLLAGALVTHGQTLARLGDHARARFVFRQAADIAQQAGDPAGAGRAMLTLIEELDERMPAREVCALFERAADLLDGSQHPGILSRLANCASRVIRALTRERSKRGEGPLPPAESGGTQTAGENVEERWENFSLKREVQRYEAELIESALCEADGVVSRAAQLLGFKHHQTFVALLNNRHKNLLHARTPIVPRKRPTAARVRAPRRTPQYKVRASEQGRRALFTMKEN
ncbi:MAG: tetratricopeptide repeat protein [Acidobacteria bacterium]|nr:tetratricopeptide repeat protein [Acidobacteriota bacterium]